MRGLLATEFDFRSDRQDPNGESDTGSRSVGAQTRLTRTFWLLAMSTSGKSARASIFHSMRRVVRIHSQGIERGDGSPGDTGQLASHLSHCLGLATGSIHGEFKGLLDACGNRLELRDDVNRIVGNIVVQVHFNADPGFEPPR